MTLVSRAASFGALLCGTVAAQFPAAPGPDILYPDGSVDGMHRLVDRNGDGTYTVPTGEAYDYLITGVNVTQRTIVPLNGWLYTTDANFDVVWKFKDVNGDGTIDPLTEYSIAMNPVTELGSLTNSLDIVTDGTSLYICSYEGTNEGIWKLTDLNADGDFSWAAGEIDSMAVEVSAFGGGGVATIPIANAPNTPGAFCTLTDLQSLSWLPTPSPGSLALGKIVVENENDGNECSIAFEDKNADGDFYDVGECYIWLNLCNYSARGLYLDASPAHAALPAPYNQPYFEVEHVVTDPSGPTPTYYVTSEDSAGIPSGSTTEWGHLFRCRDLNADGDVNDLGECDVWFDCSASSTLGATTDYALITGIGFWGGDPYLALQHRTLDEDHIGVIRDLDASGRIDQTNEFVVVHRHRNQTMYNLLILPQGFLPAPPTGNPGYYEYLDTNGTCVATGGGLHNIAMGMAAPAPGANFDDKLIGGMQVFWRNFGSKANTPLALHIGFPITPYIPLNASGSCFMSVNPFIVATGLMSDATGVGGITLTVPTSLSGQPLWWQYVALDLGIPNFNVTTSDTLFTVFGEFSFTQH